MKEIVTLPVEALRPCPINVRKKMNVDDLTELADSIKAIGVLQPITVRDKYETSDNLPIGEHYYEIVCGHRRYEASKMAGLTEVPCIVRELSDDEAYDIMVTENLQRKDVDPFDEASAFSELAKRGYDIDTLAEKFGKSRSYIFSRTKLSNLIPEFIAKYDEGAVEFSHCLVIARLDQKFQLWLLNNKYSGGYSDLTGKSVKELKHVISCHGNPLQSPVFDTTACAECANNTGCASLFMEMDKAVCTNSDCFVQKSIDVIYPKFDELRKCNPDFFIFDNWDSQHINDKIEQALYDKFVENGYTFKKGESYDYEQIERNKDDKWYIPDENIVAFSFGYRGFVGPKRAKDERKPNPYKNEWRLNDLAENKDRKIDEYKSNIAQERIEAMTQDKVRAIRLDNINYVEVLIKSCLGYIISENCVDDEEYCISYEEDNVDEKIFNMDLTDAMDMLGKYVSVSKLDNNEKYFAKMLFPNVFDNTDEEAKKRYMDSVRSCWQNYDNLTDEMVEKDLAERIEKLTGKEDK